MPLSIPLAAAAVALALYGLHRFLLWCEDRGWIYYARKRASPNALGAAFLEMHKLAEPGKQYVIESRQGQQESTDQRDL